MGTLVLAFIAERNTPRVTKRASQYDNKGLTVSPGFSSFLVGP
jgi:hypothetical protein